MWTESLLVLSARVLVAHGLTQEQLDALPKDVYDILRSCMSNMQQIRTFGNLEGFHDNRALKYRAGCAGGKVCGKCWFFREDGSLLAIRHFKSNLKDGVHDSFDEDGRLETRSRWKKGKRHGLYEEVCNPTKKKPRRLIWFRNGELDGPTVTYGSDGRVQSAILYRKGYLLDQQDALWDNLKAWKQVAWSFFWIWVPLCGE